MRFFDFPEGNDFWVVKWYDKYTQAHALSRSPSFEVLLERIPIGDTRELRALTRPTIGSLLSSSSSPQVFRTARIATGSLPFVRVGQVYKNKARAGNLPTTELTLVMPGGESLFSEVKLGDKLEPPKEWKGTFRLLNPSQYNLPRGSFDDSRCIVRRIPMAGYDLDVVVPRTLIEQTFYYPDTLMANAAALGPWSSYRDRLILDKRLETGLETGICPETGNWKVLLRTRVLDRYARLMALFVHSQYAAKSAEAIHANALIERGTDRFKSWHASGNIPFDPDLGAYKLRLRGINLRSNAFKGSETFLVTHISDLSFPERLPVVEWERENSGLDSNNGHQSPQPPIGGRSEGRGTPGRPITAGTDADPNEGNEGFDGVSIGLLDVPRVCKQVKTSHTVYTGERNRPTGDKQSSDASTGADSGQAGNPGKASGHTPLLPAGAAFIELERSLNALAEKDLISHWAVFDPGDDARREGRSGLDCWNFLPDELRNNEQRECRLPRRRWFILNPGNETPRARAALVVQIETKGKVVHWIEIERRQTEKGMGSPAFVGVPDHLSDWFIDDVLARIADCSGSGLRKLVERVVEASKAPIAGRLFEHQYEETKADQRRSWNLASVERFLKHLTAH